MQFEPLHLHKNRLNSSLSVFLLFIPAIIFALCLAFLLSIRPPRDIATSSEPSILGDQAK